MGVENWIDEVAKLAGTVAAGSKGNVRSYLCFERAEMPEALTEFPCAITYVQSVKFQGGGDSGPQILLWRGVTEFHILASVSKSGWAEVMRYYDRVLKAFVSKRTLGGKVASFGLIPESEGEAMVSATLDYGTGETGSKHLGLVAYWKVKEAVTDLTLGS